jgi:crotonobetainyl-CoA:carnitine CoA-transferase CaiB-like acyl-CoA transferase
MSVTGPEDGDPTKVGLPITDLITAMWAAFGVALYERECTSEGEKLCVVLDNAPYFAANKVKEFADKTALELCYLPRGLLELNPAEECWHRLSQRLGN